MPREGSGNGNNSGPMVISNIRDQPVGAEVRASEHFLPKRIYPCFEVSDSEINRGRPYVQEDRPLQVPSEKSLMESTACIIFIHVRIRNVPFQRQPPSAVLTSAGRQLTSMNYVLTKVSTSIPPALRNKSESISLPSVIHTDQLFMTLGITQKHMIIL